MSNEMIVIISMMLSGVIVLGVNALSTAISKRKCNIIYKRLVYLKELEKIGKIKKDTYFLDEEVERNIKAQQSLISKKTEIILYGKKYTDKTSWFIVENDILWIVGKKEDFLVQLNGGVFKNLIGG